jgi:diaminohydroxyphosphoribosylaminopyrimidine deaminase / 5-amino-6-(5-phosphoribosylamino)uracil reductase
LYFNVGDLISPDEAMSLAIKIAKAGQGFVSPNPLVGCVIVDNVGKFLSSGAHLKFGEAHAEINAIKNLTDPIQLQGATLYVTLEPCSHQGKTGSCAEAICRLPIKKVVYGGMEPNPFRGG